MRALLVLVTACQAFASPARDERLVLTGVVHATYAVEIAAPVTDQSSLALRWIVADGTTVAAGERVAELDAAPFLERVREGRTRLEAAEAQDKLTARTDDLAIAAKRLVVRQQEIVREKAALRAQVPADLVPGRTAREAAIQLVRVDAALASAKRALAAANESRVLEVKIRTIATARLRADLATAESALETLVLRAPRAGVVRVVARPGENRAWRAGDTVEQGQLLATQPDLAQPMEVVADLADVDDGRVAVGDVATCTLDAFPAEPHPCTVAAIAPIARAPSKDSLRRAFAVTLALEEHARPGLSVKVTFGRADAGEVAHVDAPIDVTGELTSADTTEIKAPAFRDRGYFTFGWIAPDGSPVEAGAPIVRFDGTELGRTIDDTAIEVAELEQRIARKRSENALAVRDNQLRVREAESSAKRAAMKTEVPATLVASLDLRAQQLDAELARIALVHAREVAVVAASTDAADLRDLVARHRLATERLVELRANVPRLVVAAPRAGTFVSTRKVGESIYQGETCAQIVGLETMLGIGVVDEIDLARARAGMPVTLRLAALPDGELRGTLAEVTADVLVRDTDPSKVVRVKIALDHPGALARPGMQFRGTIGGAR